MALNFWSWSIRKSPFRLLQQNAAHAWRRVDGVRVRHDDEGAEPAVLDDIDATGEAVDPRMIPRDGERDRRVEQDAEVVAVVRALVEVSEVGDEPAAKALLDADLDLIAPARRNGLTLSEEAVQAVAGRQQQVLVVRRLHRPPIGCAEHRPASRHGIGDAEARLDEVAVLRPS